jgi:hypothetical protein
MRAGAVVLPPFPIVTLSNGSFEGHDGLFDITFDIAVNHLSWGVADLEVWRDLNGLGFEFLQLVASSSVQFAQPDAVEGEAILTYKARYSNGGNVGGFSNELVIDISI